MTMDRKRAEPTDPRAALQEAVEKATSVVGCADNSCMFVKPKGVGTNGGCRCLGRDGGHKPGAHRAMARLYHAAVAALERVPPSPVVPEGYAVMSHHRLERDGRWRLFGPGAEGLTEVDDAPLLLEQDGEGIVGEAAGAPAIAVAALAWAIQHNERPRHAGDKEAL